MRTLALLFIALAMSVPIVAAQQAWCGQQTLYFQNNVSPDIAGYEQLINYPSGGSQIDENITITNVNGWVLIDTYIIEKESFQHTNELLKGLRRYRTYHYVSSASGTTLINFTAFKRYANGTEANFYSALTDDINSLVPDEYLTSYVSQVDVPIEYGDTLGIKVYGKTTHSSPITLHWLYQGTSNVSHFESGYFVCEEEDTSNAGAAGIVFGLVGGLIGSILVYRRLGGKE